MPSHERLTLKYYRNDIGIYRPFSRQPQQGCINDVRQLDDIESVFPTPFTVQPFAQQFEAGHPFVSPASPVPAMQIYSSPVLPFFVAFSSTAAPLSAPRLRGFTVSESFPLQGSQYSRAILIVRCVSQAYPSFGFSAPSISEFAC